MRCLNFKKIDWLEYEVKAALKIDIIIKKITDFLS